MFTVNYMSNFNGTKIFSMQNNSFINSSSKSVLITLFI